MIVIYVVAVLRCRVNCKLKLPPKTTNYTVYLITKPIISYYEKKTVNSNSKKEVKLQLDIRFLVWFKLNIDRPILVGSLENWYSKIGAYSRTEFESHSSTKDPSFNESLIKRHEKNTDGQKSAIAIK